MARMGRKRNACRVLVRKPEGLQVCAPTSEGDLQVCMHFSSSPYVPHAPPISSYLTLPLGSSRCGLEDDFKIDFKEMGFSGWKWTKLAGYRNKWQAVLNVLINFSLP
jgi:hypothetical protein